MDLEWHEVSKWWQKFIFWLLSRTYLSILLLVFDKIRQRQWKSFKTVNLHHFFLSLARACLGRTMRKTERPRIRRGEGKKWNGVMFGLLHRTFKKIREDCCLQSLKDLQSCCKKTLQYHPMAQLHESYTGEDQICNLRNVQYRFEHL